MAVDQNDGGGQYPVDAGASELQSGLGEIHGSKWHDQDGNRQWDDGEPPLAGWKIYLDEDGNGDFGDGEPYQITNDQGEYTFSGLDAGRYVVGEVVLDNWTQTFPGAWGALGLVIQDPAAGVGNLFGSSAAVLGEDFLIGSHADDSAVTDGGAIYLIDGQTGEPMKVLRAPVPGEGDYFGRPVVVADGNILVGARMTDQVAEAAGVAYLFNGQSRELMQTFHNPTPGDDDRFGCAVAAEGNLVLVAASYDDTQGEDAGAAYLFDAGTGNLRRTFYSPTAEAGDRFGCEVALVGGHVLVGAPYGGPDGGDAGEVYMFDAQTGHLVRTFSNPAGQPDDQFGFTLTVAGDRMLVGAIGDSVGGAAYLFELDTGTLRQTFLNPAPAAGDNCGRSVALIGDMALVGAPLDDTAATNAGAVYLFDATTAELLGTLISPASGAGDRFGVALAARGDELLITAPGLFTTRGAAYLFADPMQPPNTHGVTLAVGQIVEGIDFGNYDYGDGLVVSTAIDEADGDHGPGDLSLREALALAAQSPFGDVIEFYPGLAGSTIGIHPALGKLEVDSDVEILGLGAGALTIDGLGHGRILHVADGARAAISGLTITGGYHRDGGGILNSGELTLTGVTVSGNRAPQGESGGPEGGPGSRGDDGGGLRNEGTATIIRCTFSENSAGSGGAGSFMGGGHAGPGGSGGHGGGVYNARGTLTIVDSTLTGNSSGRGGRGGSAFWGAGGGRGGHGGGVYNQEGTVTLIGSTLSHNEAGRGGNGGSGGDTPGSGGDGGGGAGIYSTGGALTITDSTLSDNAAGEGGGGSGGGHGGSGGAVHQSGGIVAVSNSTFSGNSTGAGSGGEYAGGNGGDGAGLYSHSGSQSVTVTNCTFSNNRTGHGGGSFGGSFGRQGEGGGIRIDAGSATLYNTIVAGNSPDDVSGPLAHGSTHNLIGGDPMLGPLADNGGPTLTHALLPDSPAVDAGSNQHAIDAGLTQDQRGLGRFIDGDGNGNGMATVDIGACEYQGVVGRHVFYNASAFDGGDPAANAEDDAAIPACKEPLLPGQTATFGNYTSYGRGINGIMVDMVGLAATPTAADFGFKVGNDNHPAGWATLDTAPQITVRPGAGTAGSDRVTLIWPDNTIEKQWLQVTILAGGNTGLIRDDVFYFGNAIGECGNSTTDAKVNVSDMLAARDNARNFLDPAPICFPFDYNRDARVNAADMLMARDNGTHFLNALKLIAVPAGKQGGYVSPPDAARQQFGQPESTGAGIAPGELDWLFEFDPTRMPQRSADDTSTPRLPAVFEQAWCSWCEAASGYQEEPQAAMGRNRVSR